MRDALPGLLNQCGLSGGMLQAANRIVGCRTEAMGTRLIFCPNGCTQRESYNSCRHRACPQCAPMTRDHWLRGWKERLLNCSHYHIIFTVPQELRILWRFNKKTFAQSLFKAASEALLELLGDPKYLGARPGILAALHTWSQTLAMHPHVHMIVTAGGLGADGQWKRPVKSCFLPRKVLMIVFRGKLRSHLLEAHSRGELKAPAGKTDADLRSLLNRVGRMVLNVKILEQYEHGFGVVAYLARYIHGGPLGNRRLDSTPEGKIRFRARTREGDPTERHGEVRLAPEALTLRLLEHVPPHRLQTIRSYGLYASHYRKQLNEARALCGQQAVSRAACERPSWQTYCEQVGRREASHCGCCGSALRCLGGPAQERSPPSREQSREELMENWMKFRAKR